MTQDEEYDLDRELDKVKDRFSQETRDQTARLWFAERIRQEKLRLMQEEK